MSPAAGQAPAKTAAAEGAGEEQQPKESQEQQVAPSQQQSHNPPELQALVKQGDKPIQDRMQDTHDSKAAAQANQAAGAASAAGGGGGLKVGTGNADGGSSRGQQHKKGDPAHVRLLRHVWSHPSTWEQHLARSAQGGPMEPRMARFLAKLIRGEVNMARRGYVVTLTLLGLTPGILSDSH
jgi:hypothetical protein